MTFTPCRTNTYFYLSQMLIPFLRDSKHIFPYFFRPNNERRSDLRSSLSALGIFRALLNLQQLYPPFYSTIDSPTPMVHPGVPHRRRHQDHTRSDDNDDSPTTLHQWWRPPTTTTTTTATSAHHLEHARVHYDDGFAENAALLGHVVVVCKYTRRLLNRTRR